MTISSPRRRFISYIRDPRSARQVVSPFLPHPTVIRKCLATCGLPVTDDDVVNEITLARELDYEPMFMTDCAGLIFNWKADPLRSTASEAVRVIPTRIGEWVRRSPPDDVPWHDDSGCPVQTPEDHAMVVAVCEEVGAREADIRNYFREWRQRVGDNGVIVLGHPHPSWLGYQISPSAIFYHWMDHREQFVRSMRAVYEASLVIMSIALEEGVDFMSDSSYGLEMTSPALFRTMDVPYIRKFAEWTRERGGLFWYHNCGFTRRLILDGTFNTLGAHVIETIAPPPEGDNNLSESRRHLDPSICSKGNFNLQLLRDGTTGEIASATREMVESVRGFPHVLSTADAVLQGTPADNFLTFVTTARRLTAA